MAQKLKILLADDDPVFLRLLPTQLAKKDLEISTAVNGRSVLNILERRDFDVVILDVDLPDISGIEVLKTIRMSRSGPEVIILTGDTSLETGLAAMRLGAYDYITKPSDAEHVYEIIQKAADKAKIVKQNERLRVAAGSSGKSVEPVYESPVMVRVFSEAERIAEVDTTVLITGESGTGKDVLANWIHARSKRASQPLVSVNCGAIPENLVESEFFGFEKGAFTGAGSQKVGLIEAADGSTLFLDEIGEMPLALQVKLLRFLENGVFRRVGSVKDMTADVRIVAATNKDLKQGIADGSFRSDLFYRLDVIRMAIPPLRERKADITALTEMFLKRFRSKYGRPQLSLSDAAEGQIERYDWPGNVRELKNVLERTVALSITDTIEQIAGLTEVAVTVNHAADFGDSIEKPLSEVERTHIFAVLGLVDGNREKAASILGITSRTLYRKLKIYDA